MLYTIKKKCVCDAGKMFDITTGKFKQCMKCNGAGSRVIKTTRTCKYCLEPIESGCFCEACGRSFREDAEEEK